MKEVARSRVWSRWIAVVAVVAACPQPSHAIDFARLVRRAAKVADDVPVSKADNIAKSPTSRRAADDILGRIDDSAARSRAIRKALAETVGKTDPGLLRQIDALDEPAQEAALILTRGGQTIKKGLPDLAQRSQFLRDGGAPLVAALGRYDGLMDDAIRFDIAAKGGRLGAPPGLRPAALDDLGTFLYQQEGRGYHFWTTYVRPHWKLWLGGGALTAILLAPDEYLDSAGDLTQEGLRKVIKFGGETLGSAIAGVAQGMGEAAVATVKHSVTGVASAFFTSAWGVTTVLLIALGGVLTIRSVRERAFGLFRRRAAAAAAVDKSADEVPPTANG